MGDTPTGVTCPTCGSTVPPHTSHSSSTPDGYLLNNVEKATPEEIVLLVQCEECSDIFKPVFSYTGNS